MKKWLDKNLVPLVNRLVPNPKVRRYVWMGLALVGGVIAYFGISLSTVSVEQIFVLDQTPLGAGRLK